jgi:hypothetical protein
MRSAAPLERTGSLSAVRLLNGSSTSVTTATRYSWQARSAKALTPLPHNVRRVWLHRSESVTPNCEPSHALSSRPGGSPGDNLMTRARRQPSVDWPWLTVQPARKRRPPQRQRESDRSPPGTSVIFGRKFTMRTRPKWTVAGTPAPTTKTIPCAILRRSSSEN